MISTRKVAALAIGAALFAGVATAQDTGRLDDSSCPNPGESADVVICPESTFTRSGGSFVETSVYIRDERYGWLRMTPCDGAIVICETMYTRADGVVQGESVEIALDDTEPGDG